MKKALLIIGVLAAFSAYADTSSIRPPVASDVQSPTACASYAKLMSDALIHADGGLYNGIWYEKIENTHPDNEGGSITVNGKTINYYGANPNRTTLSARTLLCAATGVSSAMNSQVLDMLNKAYQDASTNQTIVDDPAITEYFGFYGSNNVCTYQALAGCTLFTGKVNPFSQADLN